MYQEELFRVTYKSIEGRILEQGRKETIRSFTSLLYPIWIHDMFNLL
jgi:hypothetical protein